VPYDPRRPVPEARHVDVATPPPCVSSLPVVCTRGRHAFVAELHARLTAAGGEGWWDRTSMRSRMLTFLPGDSNRTGAERPRVALIGRSLGRLEPQRSDEAGTYRKRLFMDAVREYAHVRASIQQVRAESDVPPDEGLRATKVGRDEPCWCRSGSSPIPTIRIPVGRSGLLGCARRSRRDGPGCGEVRFVLERTGSGQPERFRMTSKP
jgi:hypothetical protein